MGAFLDCLAVEELGQLWHVVVVVVRGDRDVLLRGVELVADLVVQQLMELGEFGHVPMVGAEKWLLPASSG